MDKNFRKQIVRRGPEVHVVMVPLNIEHRIAARLRQRLAVLVISPEVKEQTETEILLGLDKNKVADNMNSR